MFGFVAVDVFDVAVAAAATATAAAAAAAAAADDDNDDDDISDVAGVALGLNLLLVRVVLP